MMEEADVFMYMMMTMMAGGGAHDDGASRGQVPDDRAPVSDAVGRGERGRLPGRGSARASGHEVLRPQAARRPIDLEIQGLPHPRRTPL